MYKLFLTLRYLLRKRIAIFAVLSVWLCVAMVLIVFSVMDGFLDNIKQHSRGLLSDIVIDNATLQGFPYYDEFSKYMQERIPDVVELATPVIYNYGILRVAEGESNFTSPVRVVGINLDDYAAVNTFRESLHYEKYFPGTTTLGPIAKPVAVIPEDILPGASITPPMVRLPEEYEAAFKRYCTEHPDDLPDPSKAYVSLRTEFASPHGVGTFELALGGPSFVEDPLPGIIIGTDVMYQREKDGTYRRVVPRGGKMILTILPLTVRGTIAEDPIPIAMRQVDDSRTRVYEIDKICVYVNFSEIQRMLSMGQLERVDGTMTVARASQLLVKLVDGVDVNAGRDRVEAEWDSFRWSLRDRIDNREDANLLAMVEIETWEQRQRDFIAAVEKEKVLVTALFGIISLVAIVLIGVIFHMIVLQKTRDIGIIKSLGGTRTGVASVFLMYGAAVGIVGGILGVITGGVFVHYINEIQDCLAQLNPNLRVWSPDVYTFDRIPNVVKTPTMITVFIMAVVTAMLGALVPALKAASVWPVEALRYE